MHENELTSAIIGSAIEVRRLLGPGLLGVVYEESFSGTDKPQLLTYLRLCRLKVGLIINFHVPALKEGVVRVINDFIDPPCLCVSVLRCHSPDRETYHAVLS